MYGLSTLEKVNTEAVLDDYLESKPLQPVVNVEDVFHAPDYSAVDLDLLEKVSGKTVIDTYFVDSSGFGGAGEPALTVDRFKAVVKNILDSADDSIYAILSGIGQFQVYVTLLK